VKALIKVGYGCNEHCSFCHTQDVRHIEGTSDEIEAKIRRAAALGHSMVVLSGGEPTIRPELVRWATLVADLGLDLGLVTNGLVLAYPEVLAGLLERRLAYVYMSLHAGEARVHNSLVRRDSFEVALQAIENLSGRGLDLTINCVVTRYNVEHLDALVDRLLPFRDLAVKFSMVEPKGGADHLFSRLVPRVGEAAAEVRAAIERGDALAQGRGPAFRHGGFPLCLLPGLEDRFDDLRTHRFATMVEVGEPDFFPVDDDNKIKPDATCGDCRHRGPCPGLFRAYAALHGADELAPVRGGERSNAFDWVFEAIVHTDFADGDPCPLARDGHLPWDRGRHLFVRNGPKIGRYRAPGRDFDDAEIAGIKHETGQVYLDASRKPAPDDFSRDLVKLERSEVCDGCPHREPCTGLFEPVFEDVFDRDDEAVADALRSLTGSVLDVGCGEGRYVQVLRDRATRGEITYRAVDPDPDAVAALRLRWPEVDVSVGAAETVEVPDDSIDHVLVLRSWNHLESPGRVLAILRRGLRSRGTLLVVDNAAFGLARMPGQTARARRAPLRREHRRNHDAAAAHAQIEAAGFELVERRDVGPRTSNQWLLRYRLA
jgi:MoaA/NifB/PqqE/SkfB family radical SAM enzyme